MAVAPGVSKMEVLMSNRDTQFAGFACRLLQELLDQGAYVAISEWATGGDSFKSEQLIARRVYDLVAHALEHLSASDFETSENRADLVATIPDMPVLPD
jgi:hypothetical protein